MADSPQHDDAISGLLEGWGTPPPREDFVDRVVERVHASAPAAAVSGRRGRGLAFALGAVSGGLVVAMAIGLRGAPAPSMQRSTHLRFPGIADVVGEPGTRLRWERRADGGLRVEVVEGVAWVRREASGPALGMVVDGEEVELGGACGRVEVERNMLAVDAAADDVDCAEVDAAIARVRAELSD